MAHFSGGTGLVGANPPALSFPGGPNRGVVPAA